LKTTAGMEACVREASKGIDYRILVNKREKGIINEN